VTLIVDGHCHAGEGDGLTGPADTRAALDRYLARATEAGIDRTVLFSAFHSDYARANRIVASIVASAPSRFYGFAFVDAARDRGRIGAMVDEAVLRYGFRGIKVHRHDARITREVCAAARRHGIPILYDVMGEVAVVELLATEYPDVDFIIPHLGSFADDWKAQRALIDPLSRHPNVFTDTAGVRRFDVLEEAVRRAGPRKILFGSDGPWLHPGLELAKIRALRLPSVAEQAIAGGNMMRLLARRRRHGRLDARLARRSVGVRRRAVHAF
jgi:predicted TIM-barrel fold metal-dependent hydrolase